MSIKAVIRTNVVIVDYYDIADTIKEQKVDKVLYDGEFCSTQNLLSCIYYHEKGCSIINKATGEEMNFYNEMDFESWKKSVSLSDLVNCVIEIPREYIKGEMTEQYYFEATDMDSSSTKRIKLYNFEVLERDTEKLIPEVSFEETNCDRGVKKIETAVKEGKAGLTQYNHIVLLDGIDITEYFTEPMATNLRTLKKEEKGSSHFRFIHIGLNEQIKKLEASKSFANLVLKDDPIALERTIADTDKEIKELQDRLKAIGK